MRAKCTKMSFLDDFGRFWAKSCDFDATRGEGRRAIFGARGSILMKKESNKQAKAY
jgi:hypothetical protein